MNKNNTFSILSLILFVIIFSICFIIIYKQDNTLKQNYSPYLERIWDLKTHRTNLLDYSIDSMCIKSKEIQKILRSTPEEIEKYFNDKQVEKNAQQLKPFKEFLKKKGLVQKAEEIKIFLQKEYVPDIHRETWNRSIDWWVTGLTLNGYTVSKIRKLKKEGYDLLKTIKTWEEPSISEISIMKDLTIIGEINYIQGTPNANDGYHRSVFINIEEILCGKLNGNEVIIRLESGPLPNGFYSEFSDEIKPVKGDKYLFILNHRAFEQKYNTKELNKVTEENKLFKSYYKVIRAYKIVDGKLLPDRSEPFERDLTNLEKIISEIKAADKVIKKLKNDKNWEK